MVEIFPILNDNKEKETKIKSNTEKLIQILAENDKAEFNRFFLLKDYNIDFLLNHYFFTKLNNNAQADNLLINFITLCNTLPNYQKIRHLPKLQKSISEYKISTYLDNMNIDPEFKIYAEKFSSVTKKFTVDALNLIIEKNNTIAI